MIVREANSNDVDGIFNIEKECFIKFYSKEDILYEINDNPVSIMLVLIDNEKIVSYFDFWITFDSSTICRIATLKKYQRKGFAKILFDDAIKILQENKVETMTLEVRKSNERAINFYKNNGFIFITTKPKYYDDGEDALYMMKGIN